MGLNPAGGVILFMTISQWAHNVKMTSYQRRCNVITSHRRWYDVILMLCACWDGTSLHRTFWPSPFHHTHLDIWIKRGFSCLKIRQVPWEVFSHLPSDAANVNALKNHVRSLLLHKNWKHLLHFTLFLALFCFVFSPNRIILPTVTKFYLFIFRWSLSRDSSCPKCLPDRQTACLCHSTRFLARCDCSTENITCFQQILGDCIWGITVIMHPKYMYFNIIYSVDLLTLRVPRKPASENVVCLCRLLNIPANFSNLILHTGKQCGPRSDCA